MGRERSAKRREGNEIEFSRIVAFSDGVFAIAITLLVLSLHVEEHLHGESLGHALWEQRQDLLAYAISFAVIGRFWVIHHRFFGDVVGFDGRLLALNILYLAWIVLIPFSSEVLGDHGSQADAVVLYAVNLAVVAVLGWVLAYDAHRAGMTTIEPREEREFPRPRLLRRDRLPGLGPARLPLARPGAAVLADPLPRAGQPLDPRQPGRTVKATDLPGLAQSTDQPRSVTTPWQR